MKRLLAAIAVGSCALGSASVAHADQDRMKVIEAAQELRVCIWTGYYAISFRNPRNN